MRFKIAVVVIIVAAFVTGCGANSGIHKRSKTQDENGRFVIVASFYPVYISTLNVAAGIAGVSVTNMTPVQTGCPHDYQLRPADLKLISAADAFVINGAGAESFLDKIREQADDPDIIDSGKGIASYDGNIHTWVSVINTIKQVANIAEGLCSADPSNSDGYSANAAAYIKKLESLRDKMSDKLMQVKKREIVTFHEAFTYFAEEFGLEIAAVVECEPGSEPSAGELAQTADLMKSKGIDVIFSEPQYPAGAAQTLAKETDARVYVFDPVATGPDDPDAYIDIMENNLKVLLEALR